MRFKPYRGVVRISSDSADVGSGAGIEFKATPSRVSWIEAQHERAVDVLELLIDGPAALAVIDRAGQQWVFTELTLEAWNSAVRHSALVPEQFESLDSLADALSDSW